MWCTGDPPPPGTRFWVGPESCCTSQGTDREEPGFRHYLIPLNRFKKDQPGTAASVCSDVASGVSKDSPAPESTLDPASQPQSAPDRNFLGSTGQQWGWVGGTQSLLEPRGPAGTVGGSVLPSQLPPHLAAWPSRRSPTKKNLGPWGVSHHSFIQ
ncbi:hypothetical protein VULLAG_LOCUS18312 [Vulpes lagopus]